MSAKTAEQPKPKYESPEHERKDRELSGLYMKGNPGGPGNPYNRAIAALRRAILDFATPEKMQALAAKVYDMSIGGNLAAAKLFLLYAIGKPAPAPDPDLMDIQEAHIFQSAVPLKENFTSMIKAGTSESMLDSLRYMRPLVGAI